LAFGHFSVRFELLKDHKYGFQCMPSFFSTGDSSYGIDFKLYTHGMSCETGSKRITGGLSYGTDFKLLTVGLSLALIPNFSLVI
jgi:hypothetical protein